MKKLILAAFVFSFIGAYVEFSLNYSSFAHALVFTGIWILILGVSTYYRIQGKESKGHVSSIFEFGPNTYETLYKAAFKHVTGTESFGTDTFPSKGQSGLAKGTALIEFNGKGEGRLILDPKYMPKDCAGQIVVVGNYPFAARRKPEDHKRMKKEWSKNYIVCESSPVSSDKLAEALLTPYPPATVIKSVPEPLPEPLPEPKVAKPKPRKRKPKKRR